MLKISFPEVHQIKNLRKFSVRFRIITRQSLLLLAFPRSATGSSHFPRWASCCCCCCSSGLLRFRLCRLGTGDVCRIRVAEFPNLVEQIPLSVDVEAWGGAAAGRAAGGWIPRLGIKVDRCSSSDGCFFTNTTPGTSSDVNLIQNKHNGVDFPYSKTLIMQKDNVMTDHYCKLEMLPVYHYKGL